jgi:hypothetical protein
MCAMIRKQIYITAEQDEALKTQAAQRGATESEIIRLGLDRELAEGDAVARRLAAWERLSTSMDEHTAQARREGTEGVGGRDWTRDDIYDPPRGLPRHERVDIRLRQPGDSEA